MTATSVGFLPVFLLTLQCVVVEGRSAGILYEVWHSEAAQLMAKVASQGGTQLTTELVIRSNGALSLDDVYIKYGLNGDIWNVQPQLGYYCLYRHRPNDTNPPLADCANITRTATAHAQMLSGAGFDYVAIDVTNWPTSDQDGPTDIAVLRPTEVLFEEWQQLRSQGIQTPQIAVWPCSPSGSTTWQYLLDNLYNNPLYDQLVYRQDGKKVVFLPDTSSCYDAATEVLIQSNGGRNDVKTIKMWALFGVPTYAQDVWGFFSPCTSSADPNSYTTSMVDEGPCNQTPTQNSSGIIEVTASGSYMLSQTAMPFASPGHLRGLTLQRLFERVLAQGAPYLFMSSFNEFIGGRQAPASGAKIAYNMGLPNDSQRTSVWVDTYASEFSRDIEPTVEGGSRVWEVAASCVTLYKNGQTCADAPTSACCTTDDKEVFASIWSMSDAGAKDNLLTNSSYERSVLKKDGWSENCNPIPNPTAFCVDTSVTDGRNGPFMLYNQQLPNTIALYRCIISGPNKHFFSTDPHCEGQKTEYTLGYVATSRGGETLRGLYRCYDGVSHSHALDLACDNPDGPVMGYVR